MPIRLVRQCTILIRVTNLVATFLRIVIKILKKHFSNALAFVNNIVVARPKSNY
jgi:hypothetical protein